jgi:site-specific DNA-adenine methylase
MDIKSVPFSKLGNKTNDLKHFYEHLPMDAKIIVEPFAGSFAVSRMKFDPTKYEIHLSDNDHDLIYVLKNLRRYDEEKNKINEWMRDNKITKNTEAKEYIEEQDLPDEFKTTLKSDFTTRGITQTRKTKSDHTKLFEFVEKVNIELCDYKIPMEKFKNNEDAFIFIDPPYFSSFNATYGDYKNPSNEIKDNTEMYVYLAEYIKTCKCKIMIVINGNALMRYIFDGYVVDEYSKTYGFSGKKEILITITNY